VAYIAVDLDGTLAEYHGWSDVIGKPIPAMVDRVLHWLGEGKEVRIFTARVSSKHKDAEMQRARIRSWCWEHLKADLQVTAEKDLSCVEIWDDKARRVEFNTGRML
jgi:hypothetical protein